MNLTSFNRRGLSTWKAPYYCILTETLSVTSSRLYSETDLGSVRQPPKVTSCQNKIQVSSYLIRFTRETLMKIEIYYHPWASLWIFLMFQIKWKRRSLTRRVFTGLHHFLCKWFHLEVKGGTAATCAQTRKENWVFRQKIIILLWLSYD